MIQTSSRSAFCRVPQHIPPRLAAPGERERACLFPRGGLDGVGAQPVLLNSFGLKPTIEAAEPGVSLSAMRVCLPALVRVCSRGFQTKTGVSTSRSHQERGLYTCPVLLRNSLYIIRTAATSVTYVLKEAFRQPCVPPSSASYR